MIENNFNEHEQKIQIGVMDLKPRNDFNTLPVGDMESLEYPKNNGTGEE